jgi:integrase
MPRPRKPYWHDRDRCYKTRIDGKEVILRNLDGTKVAPDDAKGVRQAIDRLLAEQDARVRSVLDPSVEELCSQYLLACEPECTEETMAGKQWVLEQFCAFGKPRYGDRSARSIDATHLHQVRKTWTLQGYASGMIRRLYREVLACWAWAARPEPERTPIKILGENPLAGMKSPPLTTQGDKYVRPSAIRRLITFAESRVASMGPLRGRFEQQAVLMLRFLAESGCRPKEACTARWEDFDAEKRLLTLQRHKTARKTRKLRPIVVPSEIAAELVALRDSGYAHPTHLFAHPRSRGEASRGAERETGAPWTRPGYTAWFCNLVRAARKQGHDLPDGMTLYWLRHSYTTDAQLELDAEKAADLVGNTKEIARGTYLHVQVVKLQADAERVARRRASDG